MEGFVKPAVMLKGKDLSVGFKQNVNRQKESAALDLFSLCVWSLECRYLFKKSSFYTNLMYFSDVGTVSLSLRDFRLNQHDVWGIENVEYHYLTTEPNSWYKTITLSYIETMAICLNATDKGSGWI